MGTKEERHEAVAKTDLEKKIYYGKLIYKDLLEYAAYGCIKSGSFFSSTEEVEIYIRENSSLIDPRIVPNTLNRYLCKICGDTYVRQSIHGLCKACRASIYLKWYNLKKSGVAADFEAMIKEAVECPHTTKKQK